MVTHLMTKTMTKTYTQQLLIFSIATILLTIPLTGTQVVAGNGPVDPSEVRIILDSDGAEVEIPKEITLPELPPNPDIMFLVDTTASMGAVIAGIQADMMAIQTSVKAMEPSAQFGVSEYRDFPGSAMFGFSVGQTITANDAAVDAAAAALGASGGGDGSEGQFFALDRLADVSNPAGFRGIGTPIIVWIGDAPAHDPICTAISGTGVDITQATVTADLVAAGITVIAISDTTAFFAQGLNDDPTISAFDYVGSCAILGVVGQGTAIATATGGSHSVAIGPAAVTAAIIAAIEAIQQEVTPDASDCEAKGLTVVFDPPTPTGIGLEVVPFEETISTAVAITDDLHCEIDFLNEAGEVIATQLIWVLNPIDSEKRWTHTNLTLLVCETPLSTLVKGECQLEDGTVVAPPVPADTDDEQVYPDDLPVEDVTGDDKSLLEVKIHKNGKIQNYVPGQNYAEVAVWANLDLASLEIHEDFSECTALLLQVNPPHVGGGVIVVEELPNGEVFEITDDLISGDRGTISLDLNTGEAWATVEDVSADSHITMYVKFGPALKGENAETVLGDDLMDMCENTATATATVDGFFSTDDEDTSAELAVIG